MRRTAIVAPLGAALAFAACTVMNDLHLPRGAATSEAGTGDAACVLVQPPARPSGPGGGDPANDIVFALRGIKESPAAGYDIDGVCTCHPDPESCQPFDGGRPEDNTPHCDGDGGRDLGSAELVSRVSVFDIVDYANRRIGEGRVGLVVLVEDYNGGPNDDQVTVSAFGSGGPDRGDGGPQPPDFAAENSWSINRLHLEAGAPPPPSGKSIYRGVGHVASDTLVVTMDLPFAIATGTTTVFEQAILTGVIDRSAGRARIGSGIVAARWTIEDLVEAIGTSDFVTGGALCKADTFPDFMRGNICPILDVARRKEQDQQGVACDALSVNFGFDAVPARFGNLTDVDAINTTCDRTFRCR